MRRLPRGLLQCEDPKMDQKSSLGPELEGTAKSGPLRSPATGMARSKSISALDALAEIQAAADRVLEEKSPKVHASGDGQGRKLAGPPRCATAQPRRYKSMGVPSDHLASQCWACGEHTQHLMDMCLHCRVRLSDGGSSRPPGPPAYFHFNLPERKSQPQSVPRPKTAVANNSRGPEPASSRATNVPLLVGYACAASEDPLRKRRPPSAFELERRRQVENRKQEIQEYKRAINRFLGKPDAVTSQTPHRFSKASSSAHGTGKRDILGLQVDRDSSSTLMAGNAFADMIKSSAPWRPELLACAGNGDVGRGGSRERGKAGRAGDSEVLERKGQIADRCMYVPSSSVVDTCAAMSAPRARPLSSAGPFAGSRSPGSRSPAAALRRQAVNGRGGGNGSGGDAGMGDMRASPESLRAPHAASSMKRTAVNDLGRVQSAGTLRNVSPASADVPTPVGQSSVRGFDLAPRPASSLARPRERSTEQEARPAASQAAPRKPDLKPRPATASSPGHTRSSIEAHGGRRANVSDIVIPRARVGLADHSPGQSEDDEEGLATDHLRSCISSLREDLERADRRTTALQSSLLQTLRASPNGLFRLQVKVGSTRAGSASDGSRHACDDGEAHLVGQHQEGDNGHGSRHGSECSAGESGGACVENENPLAYAQELDAIEGLSPTSCGFTEIEAWRRQNGGSPYEQGSDVVQDGTELIVLDSIEELNSRLQSLKDITHDSECSSPISPGLIQPQLPAYHAPRPHVTKPARKHSLYVRR